MLDKPNLWKKVETFCRRIEFGELSVTVKIQDGLPHTLIIETIRVLIRDEKPDSESEIREII